MKWNKSGKPDVSEVKVVVSCRLCFSAYLILSSERDWWNQIYCNSDDMIRGEFRFT